MTNKVTKEVKMVEGTSSNIQAEVNHYLRLKDGWELNGEPCYRIVGDTVVVIQALKRQVFEIQSIKSARDSNDDT